MPLGVTFIQETTVFREFGPLAGSTMRLNYEIAPKIGDATLSRQTIDVDARKYFRLGGSGLFAVRARGFKSWGTSPGFLYFGGNSEMRGYDYLSFVGQNAFFLNAELRFPLIEAMATPIGILGGIRGTFFANMGGANFDERPSGAGPTTRRSRRRSSDYDSRQPATDRYRSTATRSSSTGSGWSTPAPSYGVSLQTFALGFPVHFDWSWKTLFNRELGGRRSRRRRWQLGVPQAEVHRVDRHTTFRAFGGERVCDAASTKTCPRKPAKVREIAAQSAATLPAVACSCEPFGCHPPMARLGTDTVLGRASQRRRTAGLHARRPVMHLNRHHRRDRQHRRSLRHAGAGGISP